MSLESRLRLTLLHTFWKKASAGCLRTPWGIRAQMSALEGISGSFEFTDLAQAPASAGGELEGAPRLRTAWTGRPEGPVAESCLPQPRESRRFALS